MDAAAVPDDPRPTREPTTAPVALPPERIAAWELVESGRYRPRRIRGSFPGRELG